MKVLATAGNHLTWPFVSIVEEDGELKLKLSRFKRGTRFTDVLEVTAEELKLIARAVLSAMEFPATE